jgi:hypothetical protein
MAATPDILYLIVSLSGYRSRDTCEHKGCRTIRRSATYQFSFSGNFFFGISTLEELYERIGLERCMCTLAIHPLFDLAVRDYMSLLCLGADRFPCSRCSFLEGLVLPVTPVSRCGHRDKIFLALLSCFISAEIAISSKASLPVTPLSRCGHRYKIFLAVEQLAPFPNLDS